MAYGQWRIDEKLTFKEFGYNSDILSIGSKKPVKCICEACGIISNKRYREANRKHRCKSIINNRKKCYKCKNFKNVSEFSKNRSTFDGYQNVCKVCYSNYDSVKFGYTKKNNKIKNDLRSYFLYKESYLRNKCKKKNLNYNLTKDFLFKLYEKQNRKCYYSGINIKHNIGCSDYNSISVERLNPNLGYVEENVVLAAFNINSFKGMMNETEFKNYLKKILPTLNEYLK